LLNGWNLVSRAPTFTQGSQRCFEAG